MLIKAAVTHEKGSMFSIEDINLAEPESGELLVKIVACGVCHTDEAARRGHRTPFPSVLGHEGAGIIERVGPDVTEFKEGDHVLLSYPYCGECSNCKDGKPYVCHRAIELSFKGRNVNGKTPLTLNGEPLAYFFGQSSFATYAIVSESNAIAVDKDLDLRIFAPLGCGIQTGAGTVLNVMQPKSGASIAVFGTGSVGLSAIMAAHAAECSTIIAIDVFDHRLATAKEFGATHTINSKEIQDVAEGIRTITNGIGVDYAFDSTGIDSCLLAALDSLHTGGVGAGVAPTGKVEFDSWIKYFIGKTWHSVIQGASVPKEFIPKLIELYKQGKFPVDKMISFFDFEDINEAFEATRAGNAIKAVLVMP